MLRSPGSNQVDLELVVKVGRIILAKMRFVLLDSEEASAYPHIRRFPRQSADYDADHGNHPMEHMHHGNAQLRGSTRDSQPVPIRGIIQDLEFDVLLQNLHDTVCHL